MAPRFIKIKGRQIIFCIYSAGVKELLYCSSSRGSNHIVVLVIPISSFYDNNK